MARYARGSRDYALQGFRRRYRLLSMVLVSSVVVGWGLVVWILMAGMGAGPGAGFGLTRPALVILASVVSVIAVAAASMIVLRSRHRSLVRTHKGNVCLGCMYPLAEEWEGKPCPECGVFVNLERCRREWMRVLER